MFVFNCDPPEDGKFLAWMSKAKYTISKTFMLSFFCNRKIKTDHIKHFIFLVMSIFLNYFLTWPIISVMCKIIFVYVLISTYTLRR